MSIILNLWMQAGSYSKFLPKRESSGLWLVSTLKCKPIRYSLNLSHAQVIAKAYFSIWVYFPSVGVNDLDAYVTGFHW